jgi:DUF1016 N-terminal domain
MVCAFDPISYSLQGVNGMVRKKPNRASAEKPAATRVPDYRALLIDIKRCIRTAQIKASLAVNRELIQLSWDIGGLILRQQHEQGWGRSIVEALATDLQAEFPGLEGFSPRNIWRMRAFHLA